MKTLLRIDSSLRFEHSDSRNFGDYFVQQWKQSNPGGHIIKRDVTKNTIPHLNQHAVEGFYDNSVQSELLQLSDRLIEELCQADEILVTAPMYNFGIPSSLKAYFDLVVRSGKTFRYEDEPIGLLQNKKAFIITAMGDKKQVEFSLMELHLKQLFSYMGITEIYFFSINGTEERSLVKKRCTSLKMNIINILKN